MGHEAVLLDRNLTVYSHRGPQLATQLNPESSASFIKSFLRMKSLSRLVSTTVNVP